jgi:uncharacterized RDD family membrane protein YckC
MRPFAAPVPGLAPRTVRLAAAFVDLVVIAPVILVWSVALGGSLGFSLGALAGSAQKRPWMSQAQTMLAGTLAWVVLAVASVVLGCLVLYQWYLLSTQGQTIGKRFMGIRIVDLEGKPAGFFSALLLRSFVFSGLISAVVSFAGAVIPLAGVFLWMLDYVPMMGEDRRCLHDYLAGTQVRWVRVVEVYVGRLVGAVVGVTVVGLSVAGVMNRAVLVPWVQSFVAAKGEVAAVAPQPVVPAPAPVSPVLAAPVPAAPVPTPVPAAVAVAPVPVPEPAAVKAEPEVERALYQFTDDQGVVHVTDQLSAVPEKFRSKVTAP